MPRSNLCSYKGCYNSAKNSPGLSFHRISRDLRMRQKWLVNSGNENFVDLTAKMLENKRICSAHFNEEDFMAPPNERTRRRLKPSAIPMPFIPENNSASSLPIPKPVSLISSPNNTIVLLSPSRMINRQKIETNDPLQLPSSDETTVATSQNSANYENAGKRLLTFHERRLMAKIVDLRKKLKTSRQIIRRREKRSQERILSKEEVMEAASLYLNENQIVLLQMQLFHDKSCEWSEDEKQFGLSLYYKSPNAYVFLQKNKNIKLPSVSLIRKWINESKIAAGVELSD